MSFKRKKKSSTYSFDDTSYSTRLVNLYSKWLDEDSNELELSQEQLAQLKEQLKSVTGKISANSDQLQTKDLTLAEKEKRLTVSLHCHSRLFVTFTGVPIQNSAKAKLH